MPEVKRGPTIKDVAACAGVSVTTVSRYLNDAEYLSTESADKIARAIEILGYRPSSVARGLKSAKMQTIAVFSSNTTLLGSAVVIEGIEDAARELGYSVMISKLDDSSSVTLRDSVEKVLDLNPAATVVLKYDPLAVQALNFIPTHIPTVVIGGATESQRHQVSLCERAGGEEITRYLLSLGHKRIDHIAVPARSDGTSRTDGWEAVLREAGLPISLTIPPGWTPLQGRELGRQLAENPLVTAIFAGNDELAMGVIRGIKDCGRRVPEDISVVGFDDHPFAQIWEPGLTTYRQDFLQAGKVAARLAVDHVNAVSAGTEFPPQYVEVPGELVVRGSAQAVPVANSAGNQS